MGGLDFSAVEKGQEESVDYDLSDNIAEDLVEYSRGNVVGNEEVFLMVNWQYGTAWMYPMERYTNSVLIGPSAGGKTQVQKAAKKLIPSDLTYTATELTGSAAQDDGDAWNTSLLAPLDEIDKIGDTVREFLKSMAGEDGGYKKKRSVQDDDSETGRSTITLENQAMPYQVLFAPEGGKESIPHELDSRMLKLYVEDNKYIREAIGRKEAGHTKINVRGLDAEYIYDTKELEGAIRSHYRQLPTVTETKKGSKYRRGASYAKLPEWVWYSTRDIFNFETTSTNRFFGMVFNCMRSSAVLNHHNRKMTTKVVDGEVVDAYLVEPQDVANVLCCQRTLLGTTHQLDPQKRAILNAVRQLTDANGEGATLSQIKDWLSSKDMSVPSKSTLRRILKEDLAEGFYIKVRDNDGPRGADLFVYRSRGSISPPRVYNISELMERNGEEVGEYDYDVDDPFDGVVDPIRDQPFKQTVEEFEDEVIQSDLESGAVDAADNDDSGTMSAAAAMRDGNASDSQMSLSAAAGDSDEDDEDPFDTEIEEWVYEAVDETCGEDGRPFKADDPPVEDYHAMGIVDEDTPVREAETTGTALDPTHDVWDLDTRDDDFVVTEADCKRELSNAWQSLIEKGLITLDDTQSEGFVVISTTGVS